MILTLVNRPHQSRSDEAEIMSHSARWSIYISITTRTRLKWPQMADVIDHTRQYCNTTWENKQENEYRLLIFPYKCSGTSVVTSWGKLLSTWRGDISCELVRKLSQDWEDDRINSAGGPKTMIRPQSCQDPEKLCLLFPQTFSMKSIVSRPLECNFSLSSLWDWDRYCMKWCTLLWLCLTFIAFFSSFLFFSLLLHFFFSFYFFSSGSCFVLFPSPIWLHFIIRLTEACHTFADLRPEDDVIEMISCGITTHMAVLHPVPVLSSSTRPCPWEPTCANYKNASIYVLMSTFAHEQRTWAHCLSEYKLLHANTYPPTTAHKR